MTTEPESLDTDSIAELKPIFAAAGHPWWLHLNHMNMPDVAAAFTERAPIGVHAVTLGECWSVGEEPASLRALALCPGLHTLAFIWCDLSAAALTALAGLELPALTALTIADGMQSGDLRALAGAAWWRDLRLLCLEGTALAAEDVDALLGHDIPTLRDLTLDVLDVGPVLYGPQMAHLECLRLTATSPAGLARFDRPVAAPALTELMLHAVSPIPMAPLVASELPHLRCLALGQATALGTPGSCRVGDDGAALIAKTWPQLKALHLHDAGIGPGGARAIGERLTGPETLVLSFNPLGAAGARALAPCLGQVKRLLIHHCQLDGDAMAALRPYLGQLEELHIRGNPIGPDGARILVETPMPALERLWMSGCDVGPEGYALLTSCERFAQLGFFEPPARDQGRPVGGPSGDPSWLTRMLRRFIGKGR